MEQWWVGTLVAMESGLGIDNTFAAFCMCQSTHDQDHETDRQRGRERQTDRQTER